MAKTKVTSHKFYVVDLIRKKPTLKYLEIPTYRVDVQIDVTTKGILSASEVPSAAMKRLEDAARGALDTYESVIASEAAKLDAKVEKLIQDGGEKGLDAAEKLIQGANQSIKNALASAEGAAQQAIEARLKKEAQGDSNLKEARARTALKWTSGAISLSTSVARLVGTMGADVAAYISIAKTLATLGADLVQQVKNEEKLRKDLMDGIQAFITLRGTTLMQAAKRQMVDTSGIDVSHPLDAIKAITGKVMAAGKEVTKGRDAKTIAKDMVDFVIKGIKAKQGDAETARKHYREHTTKTRHKTDSMSTDADKLMKAMKSATNLKDGVKIGAQCMALKRSVSAMALKLTEREKFLDEMQLLMAGNGLTIDDRTTLQKIKELDKATIVAEIKEVATLANAVKGLVEALV
ncbi:MAG TPA: hypothetical protein VFW84_02605 [Aquabacterium sp.]|uniref:hypothetical protein n=1 Tax=Aquabacterium sp. TaxID=1872578 RepID=UPI002E367E55|nr:hypothetical protein [Aquabacterium sp.]HEX5371603.1 hypothetical protein [Aquabacterium sp.]